MALSKCRLCGKVFLTENGAGLRGLCRECTLRLEDLYDRSGIHDYLRKYGADGNFDPYEVARILGLNPRDVKLLFDEGYLDRDIQVYSRGTSQHQKLAEEFERALNKERRRVNPPPPPPPRQNTSYGGRIYRRK